MMLFPSVPAGARAAWWAGRGGSLSFTDRDACATIGLVASRWISGTSERRRSGKIVRTAYRALDDLR
jgi:hypothetical protein